MNPIIETENFIATPAEIVIDNVESQALFTYAFEQAVYWAYQSACLKYYPALRTEHMNDSPMFYHDQCDKHRDIALWIHEACRPEGMSTEEFINQRNSVINRIIDRSHERAREELKNIA